VLRVRPLDTLFTAFDEPLYVDVEVDRVLTIDVYMDDADSPFTTFTVSPPIQRVRVWSENPAGSSPTHRVHKVIFKAQETGETTEIWIAYFGVGPERVEFRPGRGNILLGYITQLMIVGDKAFIRRYEGRRLAPINAPDHSKVFIEFTGFNENNDKFYYATRQEKLLLQIAGSTDVYITLNPIKNIPVTIEYYIPDIPLLAILPYMSRVADVIEGFISWAGGGSVGEYIKRFKVGVARLISKALGIHQEIIDVQVVGNYLRVTYLMDAPPLAAIILYGLAIVAGAYVLHRLITAIRDIVIEREQTVQTVEIMNAIRATHEERTKAIEAALEYARQQGLTPDQTLALIEAVGEKYNTHDIVKSTEALQEADKWKAEAESKSTERYLWALGGAAVGAVVIAAIKR